MRTADDLFGTPHEFRTAAACQNAHSHGQHWRARELISKDLTNLAGKEGLISYPPGSTDAIHRHNAHAFVYVLEGSVVVSRPPEL